VADDVGAAAAMLDEDVGLSGVAVVVGSIRGAVIA